MELKILCDCGTKFAFDVEPVDGQMPDSIQCPDCGVDQTQSANEQIRQRLAAPPAPASPGAAPLRIGAPAPAAPEAPVESVPDDVEAPLSRCAKHPDEIVAAECVVCGKAICDLCLKQFGFLCSVYCREQARKRKIDVPVYAGQSHQVRNRERGFENRILLAAGASVVLLGLLWVGYNFYISKPRLAFRLTTTTNAPFAEARWFGGDRLLVLSSAKLSLLESGGGKPVWEAPLKPGEQIPYDLRGDSTRVNGDSVWAVFTGRAVRFDARSGQRKNEVPLPQDADTTAWNDSALVTVSRDNNGREQVTCVNLQNGQARTESPPRAPTTATPVATAIDDEDGPIFSSRRSSFLPSGEGAVQLTARLLQSRMVATSLRDSGPSLIDSDNLTAGDSVAAVGQFIRGSAETIQKDESRYAVTVRRLCAASAPDWTGEVTGAPVLFPLKTVDVLVAGTNVTVLNHNNQKQWEARLTYPLLPIFINDPDESSTSGPVLEMAGRLLLSDLGMLTAFDLRTGQAAWRLPAVQISEIQADEAGRLYVVATTAGPESIWVKNLSSTPMVDTLLMKVDAATGRVLWQCGRLAGHSMISGGYLYSTRRQVSSVGMLAAAMNGEPETVHFRIWRLNPKSGEMIWEYYQPRPPIHSEALNRRLLLCYPNEIQVVKYFSL